MRDVDDETAGQRDLGGEPRALRLHRVLDRLDEHRLAALDQVLDLARPLAALELGADDLVDVEEAVLLEADLDERGLHAGQHVVDDAEVDVAGDRPALRPLEVHLGDLVVLQHGDALLARVDGHEQLAPRLRQRRALRRLPAALLRLARLALGLLLLVGGRLGGLSGRGRGPSRGRAGLLLAVPAPARPAAALAGGGAGCGCGCFFVGVRLDGRRLVFDRGFRCGSGSRERRLVLLPTEPGQRQSVSPR